MKCGDSDLTAEIAIGENKIKVIKSKTKHLFSFIQLTSSQKIICLNHLTLPKEQTVPRKEQQKNYVSSP
jgi:hypothetical protein